MKKIKLPKVDETKVRKSNEGINDDSSNTKLMYFILGVIFAMILLAIVL